MPDYIWEIGASVWFFIKKLIFSVAGLIQITVCQVYTNLSVENKFDVKESRLFTNYRKFGSPVFGT
jgi:hypothetical protein